MSGWYNDGGDSPTNEELLKGFVKYSDEELLANMTGIDSGVVLPAYTSEGLRYAYSPVQVAELNAIAKKKRVISTFLPVKNGSTRTVL